MCDSLARIPDRIALAYTNERVSRLLAVKGSEGKTMPYVVIALGVTLSAYIETQGLMPSGLVFGLGVIAGILANHLAKVENRPRRS